MSEEEQQRIATLLMQRRALSTDKAEDGEWAASLEAALMLAQLRARRGDHPGAAELYEQLSAEGLAHNEILEKWAESLSKSGELFDALLVLERLRDHVVLAPGSQGRVAAAQAERLMARCHRSSGDLEAAERCLRGAMGRLQADDDATEWARQFTWLAMLHWQRGHHDLALSTLLRAKPYWRASSSREGRASYWLNRALILWSQGKLPAAACAARAALKMAEYLQHHELTMTASHNLGIVELELGNLRAAEVAISKSMSLRRRREDRLGLARGWDNLGLVQLLAGKLARSDSLFRASAEARDGCDDDFGMAQLAVNRAQWALEAGPLLDAEVALQAALKKAHACQNQDALGEALLGCARLAIRRKDPLLAKDAALRGREILLGQGRGSLVIQADLLLGRALKELGQVEDARKLFARALIAARRCGAKPLIILGQAESARLQSGARRARSLGRVAYKAQKAGLQGLAWRLMADQGRALQRFGETRRGLDTLRRASELMQKLGGGLSGNCRIRYLHEPSRRALMLACAQEGAQSSQAAPPSKRE